jgi:hypothetical protein
MKMLIILGFLLFAVLSVFGTINMILQINALSDFEKEENKKWKDKLEQESKKIKSLSNED